MCNYQCVQVNALIMAPDLVDLIISPSPCYIDVMDMHQPPWRSF